MNARSPDRYPLVLRLLHWLLAALLVAQLLLGFATEHWLNREVRQRRASSSLQTWPADPLPDDSASVPAPAIANALPQR